MAKITYQDEEFALEKEFVAERFRKVLDTWGWKFYGRQWGKGGVQVVRVTDCDEGEVPAVEMLNLIEDLMGCDAPGVSPWVPAPGRPYAEGFRGAGAHSWAEAKHNPVVHSPPPAEATEPPLAEVVGNLARKHWFGIFQKEQEEAAARKRPWVKPKVGQVKPGAEEPGPDAVIQERPGGIWENLEFAMARQGGNPLKLPGFDISLDLDDPFGHFATESGRIGKWGFLDLQAGDKRVRVKFEMDHALAVCREAANLVVDQAGRQGLQDIAQLITDPEKARELIPTFLALYEQMGGKTPEKLQKAIETLRRIFAEDYAVHETPPTAAEPETPRTGEPRREDRIKPPVQEEAVPCPECGTRGVAVPRPLGFTGRTNYTCPNAQCRVTGFTEKSGKRGPWTCPQCGERGLALDTRDGSGNWEYSCTNASCGTDKFTRFGIVEPDGYADEPSGKVAIRFCPECGTAGEKTVGTREGEIVYNCRNEQCRVLNFSGSDSGCTIRINPDFLSKVQPPVDRGVFCPICGEPAVHPTPGIPHRNIPPSYSCENISCYVCTFDQHEILTRKEKDPRVCPQCGVIGRTVKSGASPPALGIVRRCENEDCAVEYFNCSGVLLDRKVLADVQADEQAPVNLDICPECTKQGKAAEYPPMNLDEPDYRCMNPGCSVDLFNRGPKCLAQMESLGEPFTRGVKSRKAEAQEPGSVDEWEVARICPECGQKAMETGRIQDVPIFQCRNGDCKVLRFGEDGVLSWQGTEGDYGTVCPRCMAAAVLVGRANDVGIPRICRCPFPGCDVFLFDAASGRVIRVKEKQEVKQDAEEESEAQKAADNK